MIEKISTLEDLKAFENAVAKAAEEANKFKDTEDGGSCNFDACCVRIKIPKKFREQTSLNLYKMDGILWRGCYMIYSIPYSGQANRRTRMAEAACKSLEEQGYDAHVYYQLD